MPCDRDDLGREQVAAQLGLRLDDGHRVIGRVDDAHSIRVPSRPGAGVAGLGEVRRDEALQHPRRLTLDGDRTRDSQLDA